MRERERERERERKRERERETRDWSIPEESGSRLQLRRCLFLYVSKGPWGMLASRLLTCYQVRQMDLYHR